MGFQFFRYFTYFSMHKDSTHIPGHGNFSLRGRSLKLPIAILYTYILVYVLLWFEISLISRAKFHFFDPLGSKARRTKKIKDCSHEGTSFLPDFSMYFCPHKIGNLIWTKVHWKTTIVTDLRDRIGLFLRFSSTGDISKCKNTEIIICSVAQQITVFSIYFFLTQKSVSLNSYLNLPNFRFNKYNKCIFRKNIKIQLNSNFQ